MSIENLNESQKKAATFNGKHLLVLAGAGTGKTRTIISRAAYLISSGINPRKIQILTFTKRAANEIVSRVNYELKTEEVKLLRGSTFHSWCNELLTKFPNLFGLKSFTVIDEDDQLSMMKMICGRNEKVFEGLRFKPQKLIDLYSLGRNTKRNLTQTIRVKIFNNEESAEVNDKIAKLKPQLETLLKAYEEKKRQRNYLDYDDILQIVAQRLIHDKQARTLIGSLYEHILVDEMQDTNPLQWDLLNPLQEVCNLFCVGDDAQSIYSFRGADFRNVHLFKDRVKNSEIFRLEDNYRSTQEILNLSNWLLSKSPLEYNKKLIAIRGEGNIPKILNTNDEWEEARYIADKIIMNYTKHGKSYADHLILSRSSFYTKQLQAVFIEQKIPYVTYGGRKFMEAAHIKDVISALRVVNNIQDEIAWVRFLTTWEGIGEITAAKLINNLINFYEIEHCINFLRKAELKGSEIKITDVLESITRERENVSKATENAYKQMRERLSVKYKEDWENKRHSDFPVLITLASKFHTIGEFITECILDASTKINNSPTLAETELFLTENKDKVIISTIHSAKGLEADTCFVLNVSPGSYPSTMSLGSEDEIEEDRRLLYVAMTRAKNDLIITRSKISATGVSPRLTRNIGFQIEITPENQSYFLNGMPDELVENISSKYADKYICDLTETNKVDIPFGLDFS